jgi:methyl-accepting chemotaxis protein
MVFKTQSFYAQLLLKTALPAIAVLVVAQLFIFIYLRQNVNDNQNYKLRTITNQVNSLVDFQDVSLQNLSRTIELQHEKYANVLMNNFNLNPDSLLQLDLYTLRSTLLMDQNLDDISIINSSGIVVSTTSKKDYLLNLFATTKNAEDFFIKILSSGKYTPENVVFEKQVRKFRKSSYIATSNQKFVFRFSSYNPAFDQIAQRVSNALVELIKSDNTIRNIEVYLNAEEPFSLNQSSEYKKKDISLVKNVFRNKISEKEILTDQKNVVDKYVYIEKTNRIFEEFVIKITIDKTFDRAWLRNKLVISLLFLLLLAVPLLFYIFRSLKRSFHQPILNLKSSVEALSKGDLGKSKKLDVKDDNEIGAIAQSVNNLIEMLNATANFSKEIGAGNLDAELRLQTENDLVGQSLLEMQQNLKRLEVEKQQRDLIDQHLSWISNGLTHFNKIMREDNDDIEKLGKSIINNLVKYTKSTQGAFFALNNLDAQDPHLDLVAAWAYNKQRYLKKRIELNEGLAGMCALEKYTIYRTEIPENYYEIESGLGNAIPKALIFVPIKLNEEIFGVIELASFEKYEPFQIEFLEKLAESISYTLSALKNSARNEALLEQTRYQSVQFSIEEFQLKKQIDELKKQLEMSQNNEFSLNQQIERLQRKLEVAVLKIKELRNKRTSFSKIRDDED